MRTEDVPTEIVEAAAARNCNCGHPPGQFYDPSSHSICEDGMRDALATVWDQILERGKVEKCTYTFAHTRHWCGNQSCRDS